MQRVQSSRHMVDLLFTLALFGVFAVSALMVVLMGANVYKQTAAGMVENFDSRISLTYIWEKVKQADAGGSIYLDEIGGNEALVLEQEFNGRVYHTLLYVHDGELRELFAAQDAKLGPEAGQIIMEASSLDMEQLDNGLLRFTATSQAGKESELLVVPRGGRS